MVWADGMPAWNATSCFVPGGSHSYAESLPQIAVVVGRTAFDLGHRSWSEQSFRLWTHLCAYVLTAQPLSGAVHDGVVAAPGGPSTRLSC